MGRDLFEDQSSFETLESTPEENLQQLRINAARLDNENVTSTEESYMEKLSFLVKRAGRVPIRMSNVKLRRFDGELRRFDGEGGQTVLEPQPQGAEIILLPGDVTAPDDPSRGDGRVDFDDLALWSTAYWSGVEGYEPGLEFYKSKFDFGPTSDGSIFGTPQPDGKIEFEDVVIFANSYGFSAEGSTGKRPPARRASNQQSPVHFQVDKPTRTGTRVRVPIRVDQVHDLRAFSLNLHAPGFEYVRVESGRLMLDREGRRSFLSGMDRTDHVRIDGAVLGGKGLSGQGVLARVILRPESPSAHPGEVRFVGGDLRNSRNEALSLSEETGTETKQVPSQFVLKDNYPNPFNPRTTIRYGVPEATHVRLTVYDRLGREVAVLVNQRTEAGIHRATFHAEDLPTGSYLYQMEADGYTETKSMMIVK